MNPQPGPRRDQKQYWFNLTLAGVAGQVGCLTFVILIAAVLGGLWLDAQFGTRPAFTLILVIVSIPISLVAMFFVVRLATSKIKAGPPPEKSTPKAAQPDEEVDIDRGS